MEPAAETPQGRAIRNATRESTHTAASTTLPFAPCKKGFTPFPIDKKKRMYACPLHHKARKERVEKEHGQFRPGEVDLHKTFWEKRDDNQEQLNDNRKEKRRHRSKNIPWKKGMNDMPR
mmetsp:Transcript_17571/g.40824  ORF Transcript_17571/g.40824 Transcript_17571/m.40824 type:complete len:119 (+) Transcript_17571:3-359(+)